MSSGIPLQNNLLGLRLVVHGSFVIATAAGETRIAALQLTVSQFGLRSFAHQFDAIRVERC